jgi:Ornithine cyclodeaminase/mu-crystallin family
MSGRNYDVLLLRPQEIKDVIDIKQAINLVEQGYREAHGFPIINASRRRVHSKKNVRVSNFPGGVDGLGVIGSLTRGEQVVHDPSSQEYPYREHPVYLLWDSTTARLRCIMIGEITEKRIGFSSLMALRTAATSGVGFRHLVRKDAKIAGVFGAGGQALHKILALQNERPIETSRSAYSRSTSSCPLPVPTTSGRCRRSCRATSTSPSACWRCRSSATPRRRWSRSCRRPRPHPSSARAAWSRRRANWVVSWAPSRPPRGGCWGGALDPQRARSLCRSRGRSAVHIPAGAGLQVREMSRTK